MARIDFSMLEAMLWTLAEPLLSEQLGARSQPAGNRSELYAPHGTYRCAGDDYWISLAVTDDEEWRRLCAMVGALSPLSQLGFAQRVEQQQAIDDALSAWARLQDAEAAEKELLQAGIPAAALARSVDLVKSHHLHERGFWDPHGRGVLPGLPWRASFGRIYRPAPELGAHSETVLRDLLGVSLEEIAALRQSGALG